MPSESSVLPLLGGTTVSGTVVRLLCDLDDRGIALRTDGDKLLIRPRAAVTTADLQLIAHWKPSIIQVLRCIENVSAQDWLH